MSRATACFSIYSDISNRSMASSSPKSTSANARQSSVFPTPVGPRNKKEPMGRAGVFQPYPAPANGPSHSGNSLLLPHHPLVQGFFQRSSRASFFFRQAGNWHPRPHGDDGCDVLRRVIPRRFAPVSGRSSAPAVLPVFPQLFFSSRMAAGPLKLLGVNG